VLIALPISGGNASAQQFFRFSRTVVLRQRLGEHLISRHVIGVGFEQCLEM
jgi:hypothetical protein